MTDRDRQPNDEEQTPKFKIIDRRRIDADEIEASEAPPEPEPEAKAEAEPETPPKVEDEADAPPEVGDQSAGEQAGESETEQDPLEFRNIALSFLQTLNSIAWVHMGLVPHPQTQIVTKKMEEARKTIELLDKVFEETKRDFSPEINSQIEGLLQDLKANYVNQL